MRKMLMVSFVLIFLGCSNDDEGAVMANQPETQGPIFLKSVNGGIASRNYTFSENQRVVAVNYNDRFREMEYVYDTNNNLQEVILLHSFETDTSGQLQYKKIIVDVNSDTQFTARLNKYSEGDVFIEQDREFEFTFDGSLIKEFRVTLSEDYTERTIYNHDEEGRLISRTIQYNDDPTDYLEMNVTQWSETAFPHLISAFNVTEPFLLFPDKFISLYGLTNATLYIGEETTHLFEYNFSQIDNNLLTAQGTLPYREDFYEIEFDRYREE